MTAEPIGSLRVFLGLDSAQFSEGLKKSKTEIAGFAKTASLAGAALGAALAGSAAVLGAAVKGAIDQADQLGEMSEKVGLSVESLSRLKYAAEISGVSLDTLTTGLKKLSVGLIDAAEGGSSSAAKALARLGISAIDASGALKSSDQVLSEVSAKFAAMENDAQKTALAIALFGKSGADLIPMLNQGADGIAKLQAEADRLGVTISKDTAEAAGRFNENLDKMRLAGQGVAMQLAQHMLPAIEGISTAMVSATNNAAALTAVGRVLGGMLQGLASAAVAVAAAVKIVGYSLFGTFGAALKLMQADFKGAQEALRWGGQGMVDAATGAISSLKAIWSGAGSDTTVAERFADNTALPFVRAGEKVKAAGDKAAKEAKAARDKILAEAERVHDSLLTEDEAYLKDWIKRRDALEAAMRADLGNRERYLEALDRLYREREARGIEPAKAPGRVDFVPGIPSSVEIDTKLGDLIKGLEEARRAADEVSYSIEDVFYGFRNNDWGMAVSGLLKALKSVKDAMASGSGADTFTALAGVAQGVGNAIGGGAGGALSGAASGAMAGLQVGGLPGAIIGGIIGGVAGLFSGNKAKKQAKREAEERARQAEAERLARVEAARKELEIQLMRANGDAVGALAKQRQYELEALDASLHEQQKAVWAAEDLAEANAKLAAITAGRVGLEVQLMEAMGDTAGALAAQREEYLRTLDESLRPLQTAVWSVIDANTALTKSQEAVAAAQDVVREAYDREASAYRETIDRFRSMSASLRSYAESIGQAENGTNSLAAAAQKFAKVSAAARLGDENAMGQLQGAAEAYRTAGRDNAKTLLEQLRIDAQVRSAVEAAADTADRQASIAERQLEALTQMLPANLREIQVTFAEGMVGLNEAMNVQEKLQLEANANLAAIAESNAAANQAYAIAGLAAKMDEVIKNTKQTSDTLIRVTRDGDGMVVAA